MDFLRSHEKFNVIDLSRPILVSMEAAGGLLSEFKVLNDDGSEIEITLIQFDTLSRNNSEYPVDDLMRSMNESRYVQENKAQRTWFGEDEHPPQGAPMERFMFVEPARRAWLIKDYWQAGDLLKGKVAFVPPMGTALQEIITKHGSNYAASLRAYTPNFVKKQGPKGEYIIKKYPMYPVTFDAVACPGLYKARMVDPDIFKQRSSMKGAESFYQNKNIIFEHPESELKKMLSSQESIKVLQDMFHFDAKKSTPVISGDRVEFTSESGSKVMVPVNTYLIGQALNSLKK